MSVLSLEILADRVSTMERSLKRLEGSLPPRLEEFKPGTDPSDSALFHLSLIIPLIARTALTCCQILKLKEPATYAEAFQLLSQEGYLEEELALRLSQNVSIQRDIPYAAQNKAMLYTILTRCPPDFRAFFRSVYEWLPLSKVYRL